MNAPQYSRRPTAAVVVETLLWLWLICLSVFVVLGYQAMRDLADQKPLETRLQRIEAQAAGLADSMQQRPPAATAASLQDARQALEARIAQIEEARGGRAAADDLQALRAEFEHLKSRHAAAFVQQRAPGKPAAKPEPPPLPFRVIGAELRAGQRSVSVAPGSGDFTPGQLQVLLPGDAVGPWRLQAVEGSTAVFQAGDQTRRVAIP
ncbi:MAG: hypothetical protein A2710_23975 [Burkholderiales bacterium RIFCSPHIGHO2_01_FULL_64_960]|nr:MAG: hypothetical protein A2710_23975 [Burkholderiales bacterium RIFCSPHIGHO2_01_FULL_64_960]